MSLMPMCLCFVMCTLPDGSTGVLLGQKKRGLGAGYVVGLGGHVEEGESVRSAAAREVTEECGLTVDEIALDERATVIFRFPTKPSWDQEVTVFVTDHWHGDLLDSDEIAPSWYGVDALPLELMWDDARYWLPRVLHGERFNAEIIFADDQRTVTDAKLNPRG